MANCAVCGDSLAYKWWNVSLCAYHGVMFRKWLFRWMISTGHKIPTNMKSAKIVNMLKNMDAITKVKRAKV